MFYSIRKAAATLAKGNSTEMKLNSSVISDEEIKILGRFDLL